MRHNRKAIEEKLFEFNAFPKLDLSAIVNQPADSTIARIVHEYVKTVRGKANMMQLYTPTGRTIICQCQSDDYTRNLVESFERYDLPEFKIADPKALNLAIRTEMEKIVMAILTVSIN